MHRHTIACAVVAAVLGLGGATASAQYSPYYGGGYGGMGWASTPGGDIARGMGVYAMGLGQYNLSNAYAGSINTDTAMRWNTYLWQAEVYSNTVRYEYLRNRRLLIKQANEAIADRLKNHPTPEDIVRGDALNTIKAELTAPKVRLTTLKTASVPLPSRASAEIPFQYASEAVVICLQQLTVENGWPLPLRAHAFDEGRKAYEKAIDEALKLDLNGELTPESIAAVRDAVKSMHATLKENPPEDKTDFINAEQFLKGLAGGAKMLQSPTVESVVAELQKKPVSTVGDLLAFMEMFNLRFAPAKTPQQKALYENLYSVLVKQRDELMAKLKDVDPDALAEMPENIQEGSPSSIFQKMEWDHLHHNIRKQ